MPFSYHLSCPVLLDSGRVQSDMKGSPALDSLLGLAGDRGNSARHAMPAVAIMTTDRPFAMLSVTGLSLASSNASAA